MIRIAAVGDIHMGPNSQGVLRPAFETLPECADLLLLAGDLTRHGTPEEMRVVAREVQDLTVPVIAVLGNHDHHDDRPEEVTAILRDAGVHVLEGQATVVESGGARIGVAGTKGFGGGFVGRCAGEFGEPVMKEFVRHSRRCADGLRAALEQLEEEGCDARIALTHYSPSRTPWRASRWRSTRSWGATCWPKRSTPPGPTSRCTGTRTRARSTA